ncbi:MAG: response regulator [Thermodesulfobacteriota bacterium]|nr:response regulator [Thermodesulfobacteriota bacterium]
MTDRKQAEPYKDSLTGLNWFNNIPIPFFVVDKKNRIMFINQACADLVGKEVKECRGVGCFELFKTSLCQGEKCAAIRAMRFDRVIIDETTADLAAGEIPVRFTCVPLKDEQGNITGAIEYFFDISDEMRVVEIAEKISKGDYSVDLSDISEGDRMGRALAHMTKIIKEMTDENKRQDKLKSGLAALNDIMRGEQEIGTLATNIITFVASYIEAQIGALYIILEDKALHLMGSYAYTPKKGVQRRFILGEGMVGQAALEKKSIVITRVPDDYIHITSGIGGTIPSNLLIHPAVFDNNVKGVIELGFFSKTSNEAITFIEQAGESIAVAIESALSHLRTSKLLEQTQEQAKMLQKQQEDLRIANEELEEHTAELKKSQEKLESQQKELKETNKTLKRNAAELEKQTVILESQKSQIEQKNFELERAGTMLEEKARALELSSKYKSEFLANMSHELRTPLNSIILLARLLTENRDGRLNKDDIESARAIHSSGADLLALINDVLDLSKIEAGKMDVVVDDIHITDLTQVMTRYFKPMAAEKGLALNIELAEDLPRYIRSDRQRLEQILKNFLSNGLKFTLQGSVTLNIGRPEDKPGERITLSKAGLNPQETIRFSVIDTGIGISPDKQDLVFHAFQQVDGSTSRQYEGTGLGLSISMEFADLLGGTISLTSTPGKGSTFSLYLPEKIVSPVGSVSEQDQLFIPRAGAGPSEIETPADQTSSRMTAMDTIRDDRRDIKPDDKLILIIEDDPGFLKIFRDLARGHGFKWLAAGDGEIGLHFAEYHEPNAILLDIELPGINGWAVMTRLKDNPRTRHIPVHVISGAERDPDAMKMGVVNWVTKPVKPELLDKIFDSLDQMILKSTKELLIVVNDPLIEQSISECIGNGDIKITFSSTVEEAYNAVLTGKFDCMILEFETMGHEGEELLDRMHNTGTDRHLPIIVFTERKFTENEKAVIFKYSITTVIKCADSVHKLINATTLFLHRVEADLPPEQQEIIRSMRDQKAIFMNKKILLVDDNMRNLFRLRKILEEKGLEVLVAKHGKDALKRINEQPDVRLVLMEIMMPVMDGYEAIREIRKQERFADLPVIALTSKAMRGDQIKCIKSGASDYIAKPVDPARLFLMLREWLYE